MTISFNTAAVIGTGMMGPGIAATLALGGLRTTILSRSESGAREGLDKALSLVRFLKDNGIVGHARAQAAIMDLGAGTLFEEAVAQADLVVESVPEDLGIKQQLFAKLDCAAPPHAVLASNTSSLSITAVASRCAHPERVLSMHFWNPPHLMPLVEIVKGEKTSQEAADAVRELLISCGKTPVLVKKDRPGQLGNRLQHALLREAVNIVAEGIADAEDVDLAAKKGFGLRLPAYGILEHADAVGLEMAFAINDYIAKDLYNKPQAPELLRQMVTNGETGARAGKGFYDWSERDFEDLIRRRDQFVLEMVRRFK
ncbi:MAG TPA: 3-hydroxyacyl-CoA dehydrogenase family protein [Bryobacteraceae bacterium]|nr:3-hydroxyacyl-CoA dehydrogenase family protein [Bryobacteraceae bacterium]HOL72325.1 3-hydroxyacyl-CoA dehydrogenase family protein [Bryobacteraceae bacterium]HOQ44721.1 3-hydroxyacyl-CoA dehydrogenase family protein [Bryobacteraceae bacterium]HPQ15797.1 3-hydroxyacyl-CoA dehydrogenase family protein [Bryobacteraceae bacterium]HPU71931.1 3-hydroxyacyl-CoA dehydrogenase family protein [Bryobacteraceae bacterium]